MIGKEVKIWLKNNLSCEGVIKSWDEKQVSLSSKNSEDTLIIFRPLENIVMMQIVLPKKQDQCVKSQIEVADPKDLNLDHYEPDPNLRFQKLAELRKAQIQEERQAVRNKLTSWKSEQAAQISYEQPSFTNPAGHSSSQKGDGAASSNLKRLQRVSRKTS